MPFDELKFFLGLSAITLAVVALVIYFGLKLKNAVLRRDPEALLQMNITPAGTLLWVFIVGFWIVCIVAAKLRPESSFGSFVGTADGVAAVATGSIFFAALAAAILEKIGYPIVAKG